MRNSSGKYIITCPKCGKVLFKSMRESQIEVQCPKCHSELTVMHSGTELKVCEHLAAYNAEKE
ncbi:MAG: hypothetical protein PHE51_11425 [Eubacteriales bacterium]|nr:hypothetical protein [Eubacteriales bacterium]